MKRDSTGSVREYRYALRQASPIVAGYFTVSFVFGIMAVHQGLPIWLPALMSMMVYAGASQFSFLTLAVGGASLATIVLTTFLINLRHMLMSVYMSSAFEKIDINEKLRLWYAFGLTDESFATHSVMLGKESLSPKFLISFNTFCHVSWVLGSLSGSLAALYASELVNLKLDYALMAMMLYVLVSLIDSAKKLMVALVSIAVMSLLSLTVDSHINVFIATFVGCWVATWNKTKIFSS